MSTARIAGNAAIVGMGTFVGYKFLEEDNDTGVSKSSSSFRNNDNGSSVRQIATSPSYATKSFTFSASDGGACAICLDEDCDHNAHQVELGCGHHFCRPCLTTLAESTNQSRCPTCRADHVVDPEVLSANMKDFRADYAKWRVGGGSTAAQKNGFEAVTRESPAKHAQTQNTVSGATGLSLQKELSQLLKKQEPATKTGLKLATLTATSPEYQAWNFPLPFEPTKNKIQFNQYQTWEFTHSQSDEKSAAEISAAAAPVAPVAPAARLPFPVATSPEFQSWEIRLPFEPIKNKVKCNEFQTWEFTQKKSEVAPEEPSTVAGPSSKKVATSPEYQSWEIRLPFEPTKNKVQFNQYQTWEFCKTRSTDSSVDASKCTSGASFD